MTFDILKIIIKNDTLILNTSLNPICCNQMYSWTSERKQVGIYNFSFLEWFYHHEDTS